MLVTTVGAGVYLLAASVYDIKYRGVPERLILVFMAAAAVSAAVDPAGRMQRLLGGGIGILLLLAGRMTQESIGYGDGWSVLIVGLLTGLRAVFFIMMAALLLSAVYSIVLLVWKKAAKNTAFPFIPFLCAAFYLWVFLI